MSWQQVRVPSWPQKPVVPRPPTAKQLMVLRMIATAPPTLQEIATALGTKNGNAARDMVGLLERKGLLTRERYARRGLALTEAGKAVLTPRPV